MYCKGEEVIVITKSLVPSVYVSQIYFYILKYIKLFQYLN